MSQEELNKWAKDNNSFFKLEAGQHVTAEYQGFIIIPNSFDPEKEQIRYTLLVNGIKKYWNSSSTRIAEDFSKVKVGEKVVITKEATKDGKGKYFVRLLSEDDRAEENFSKINLDLDTAK